MLATLEAMGLPIISSLLFQREEEPGRPENTCYQICLEKKNLRARSHTRRHSSPMVTTYSGNYTTITAKSSTPVLSLASSLFAASKQRAPALDRGGRIAGVFGVWYHHGEANASVLVLVPRE